MHKFEDLLKIAHDADVNFKRCVIVDEGVLGVIGAIQEASCLVILADDFEYERMILKHLDNTDPNRHSVVFDEKVFITHRFVYSYYLVDYFLSMKIYVGEYPILPPALFEFAVLYTHGEEKGREYISILDRFFYLRRDYLVNRAKEFQKIRKQLEEELENKYIKKNQNKSLDLRANNLSTN